MTKKNNIYTAFALTFFVVNLVVGQTIKENGKEIKLHPETEKKISILADSLVGNWLLIKTIRWEKELNGFTNFNKVHE
jgi:hypothetical protein